MARPYDVADAKRLIGMHQRIFRGLNRIESSVELYSSEAKEASDALVTHEVLKILTDIPIEEINRDKQGIRTKLLRDCGYETLADVATASVYSLASINGISESSAYTIKKLSNNIVSDVRKATKIRLSVDNRSKEASELVCALLRYQEIRPVAAKCRNLLTDYQWTITNAEEDLRAANGKVKWLFASKAKKQRALKAYDYLSELANGPYGREAQSCITSLEKVEQIRASDAWQEFSANPIAFFNNLEDINPGVLGNDDAVYGLPEELAREIQDESFFPEGLLCELRRYQEWGVKYILHQKKVLLGDEMGLGKTIQAIATMVSLRNTGGSHFVVVCPASVLENWCREINSKSRLSVTKIHGSTRNRAFASWINTGGVAVTTYETISRLALPEGFSFKLLVVDEAHYVKNPSAKRTKSVKELAGKAERLLFMTGTALENNVNEMISLIHMLQPKVASKIQGMVFMPAAPQFRKAIAPVYYRRKRENVLTELPDLIESKEWCVLGPEEERAYEDAVLYGTYMQTRRVSWNVADLRKNSSKAKRLLEIVTEAEDEGRKVVVFSFFLDTLRELFMLLGDRCYGPINGSVPPAHRQEIIDEFEKAPAGSVLVAQIQSGGTGLNIQSASVVVICEPQFKPSTENQAISRAYRMGQTRNVLVYRLLCENTVDEKLVALLESKQAIFNAFADKSVAAEQNFEIDDKAFGNIIQEEIDRINAKRNAANNNTSNKNVLEKDAPSLRREEKVGNGVHKAKHAVLE